MTYPVRLEAAEKDEEEKESRRLVVCVDLLRVVGCVTLAGLVQQHWGKGGAETRPSVAEERDDGGDGKRARGKRGTEAAVRDSGRDGEAKDGWR